MEKLLFILVFATLTSFAQAQISDEEAKQAYKDAEEQYEAGNYYKCYQMCNELIVKIGKPNPRILYLDLKAIYNNLEKKNDKSEYTLKRNYKNYKRFSGYADDFFSAVDKSTYPTDKYNEMLELQKYLNAGMKEYEYEKDRKPTDAINFLNECSSKFSSPSKKVRDQGECDVKFSLDSTNLIIDVLAKRKDFDRPKSNEVGREKIVIDLSKAWIENKNLTYYEPHFNFDVFFWSEFGNSALLNVKKRYNFDYPAKDENAPLIVGPKIYLNGDGKIDNITWFFQFHYDKKFEYPDEQFNRDMKFYGTQKLSTGFYLYSFFNQLNDEFRDNNYRKRILDAFEFLIDFYGGGTPIETKQENKNKF